MTQTQVLNERSALPRSLRPAVADRPSVLASSPWPIFRANARSIGPAIATCLVILVAIELAVFRSGFFISNLRVSSPDFPTAKLALAARMPDARVLYVGDSTVLTGVAPQAVAATCECGPGFNAAFAASNPWLTSAMTRRLLAYEHPALVVIGVAPWDVESGAVFSDSELAHEVLSPAESAALGTPLDLAARIDALFAQVSSAYGQRLLIKEWLASLMPNERYDEAQRGYYAVPGSASGVTQLAAEVVRMKAVHPGDPTVSGPGAAVTRSLIAELRARGIAVAILVPPIHPAAYEQNGAFLERGDAAVRALAIEERVPVIDCRSAVSLDDFRDLLHLRESGAQKQSACVGDQLQMLLPN